MESKHEVRMHALYRKEQVWGLSQEEKEELFYLETVVNKARLQGERT